MADRPPPPAGQPDELSPLDYLLHRGEAHPATRSAFLDLEILDRPADWGRLREAMDRASRVVIRMRQKVVVPPVPTTPPRWVVDPDFDLDYHLRRVALPAPGTLRQLLDLAEVTLQSPLDTSRALWEALYVEGLEGNRAALLIKLSHAITDGLGGLALFEQIYDTAREPEPRPMPPVPVPRDLSGEDLVRDSLRQWPATTLSVGRKWLDRAVGTAAQLVTRPGPTVAEVFGFADSARRMLGPPPAEPSPLLRRRSLMTHTHVLELPLTDLRAAAKAVGGSVNDAYLAALCGGLGRYHEVLGVPVEALPLTIPVSLRTDDDPASGNRFTGVTIAAPIGESDPVERMKQIREQVIARRSEPAIDVLGRIAPVLIPAPRRGAAGGHRTDHAAGHPGQQRARLRAGDVPGRGESGPAVRDGAAAPGGHDGDPHLPGGHVHGDVPLRHGVVHRRRPAREVPAAWLRRGGRAGAAPVAPRAPRDIRGGAAGL